MPSLLDYTIYTYIRMPFVINNHEWKGKFVFYFDVCNCLTFGTSRQWFCGRMLVYYTGRRNSVSGRPVPALNSVLVILLCPIITIVWCTGHSFRSRTRVINLVLLLPNPAILQRSDLRLECPPTGAIAVLVLENPSTSHPLKVLLSRVRDRTSYPQNVWLHALVTDFICLEIQVEMTAFKCACIVAVTHFSIPILITRHPVRRGESE